MPNPILDKIKGLFANGAANLIEKAGKALDDNITNKEELIKAKTEQEKVFNDFTVQMAEIAFKESQLAHTEKIKELEDIANARAMQIEALKQEDGFSKRFVYYLAIGIIALTFSFDLCFFFIQYPERNHDIINMIAGTLNSTGFAAVIYFFFGSSQGSKANGDAMRKMLDK